MKAKHHIFAWAMLAVLLTHSFGINVLYGLYNLNQPLFVELFCINKDKPEMHCDGTCMLSKLDDQQAQNQNQPVIYDLSQYQLTFVTHTFDFQFFSPVLNQDVKPFLHYKNFYTSQFLEDLFRPPILV